jgi:DNA repair exonuclease SbcCD nuclease subunit
MSFHVLCIGDIHVQTSNLSQMHILLSRLEDFITQNNETIDIILFMGDILHNHERLHTVPFNFVTDMFNKLRKLKPLYVLVGNHDYINNSQFLSNNHWMNCFRHYDNMHIIDHVVSISQNNYNIILCPFVPDGRFVEALNSVDTLNWKKADAIFAHQLLDGAKMGAIVAENIEKWNEAYPLVISGHIHDKQKPQSNLYYTGSCIQHAFGEKHDKTICLVKIDTNISLNEIDLKLPTKQILYYDMDEIINTDTQSSILQIIQTPNVQYKITISGDYSQFKQFKKSSFFSDIQKNGTKIVFKSKAIELQNKRNLLKQVDSLHFKDILLELIQSDEQINSAITSQLLAIYSEMYNIDIFNNKHIVFSDNLE